MAYTPTVYTNNASSPDLDATNLNKSENGIKDAHLIAQVVDCSSRVAEYTGDGIPLIPDNVAGAAFIRDNNWSSVTPFIVEGSTASYVSGKLVLTATSLYPQINTNVTPYVGKCLIAKVRKISGTATFFGINVGGTTVSQSSFATIQSVTITHFISPSSTGSMALVFAGATVGDTYEIEALYIGTGAYDYQNKDRAGNGNNLTLNAVTPVNGKYCKEMSFNGTTSYAQASSPVIGTTGTVAVRWKRNRIGTAETIVSNQSATTDGLRYHIDASNNLYAIIGGSSPVSILIKSGFTDTTASHTFGIKFSDTSATPFYDGVEGTAVSATQVLGLANLAIGRNQIDSTGYASGQGYFRADSRIWTADEARSWSLNPISIDSRV